MMRTWTTIFLLTAFLTACGGGEKKPAISQWGYRTVYQNVQLDINKDGKSDGVYLARPGQAAQVNLVAMFGHRTNPQVLFTFNQKDATGLELKRFDQSSAKICANNDCSETKILAPKAAAFTVSGQGVSLLYYWQDSLQQAKLAP